MRIKGICGGRARAHASKGHRRLAGATELLCHIYTQLHIIYKQHRMRPSTLDRYVKHAQPGNRARNPCHISADASVWDIYPLSQTS